MMGMKLRSVLVLFCCFVVALPGHAHGGRATTPAGTPAPKSPDWKTLYTQADSAARLWEQRSGYLEASCQELRNGMDADTAAQTLAEAGEPLPAVPAPDAALPTVATAGKG